MDRAAGYASHLDRIGAETIGATARLISTERSFTKFRCVPNLQELAKNLMLAIDSFGLTNIPYCMQYPLYLLHWGNESVDIGSGGEYESQACVCLRAVLVTLGRGRIIYDFRGCQFRRAGLDNREDRGSGERLLGGSSYNRHGDRQGRCSDGLSCQSSANGWKLSV